MSFVDLPLHLDRAAGQLGEQLAGQLREALAHGRLTPGERLPSSRALAASLAVSRTVVTEAFQQLYAEGWLEGRHGSGTYVAEVAPVPDTHNPPPEPNRGKGFGDVPAGQRRKSVPRSGSGRGSGAADGDRSLRADLRAGRTWGAGIEPAAWRRAWRAAAAEPVGGWADPAGDPGLRRVLAGHLRRTRGVVAPPGRILITGGVAAGLDLAAATLLRPGDRVGVEEPGYAAARAVLAGRGAAIVPCPVDRDGLVVPSLPRGLRMVYVTPAHQYPLGGRLPVPRRQALLAWAREHDAVVVEDDYDSEFRYDVAPLPALYGLDPGVVIHLGTTSKVLSPTVGVGWLVAGGDLAGRLARRRESVPAQPPAVAQAAVRELIARGDLERHVRRVRKEYARRRAALVGELAGLAVPAPVRGDTAGLHVVVELPAPVADAVSDAAERAGIGLSTLRRYHHGTPRAHGIVLGYGGETMDRLVDGARVLVRLINEATATRRSRVVP